MACECMDLVKAKLRIIELEETIEMLNGQLRQFAPLEHMKRKEDHEKQKKEIPVGCIRKSNHSQIGNGQECTH